MDKGDLCLHFKVDQVAEAKSFEEGFRSAWFRCKIKKISRWKGVFGHHLEYFDYPDEKVRWVSLYKTPPYPNQGFDKMVPMLRPHYPPLYHQNDLPDWLPESDVVVIVNDTWKVGDLVDWWYEGCFWSGRITRVFNNAEVQIKLPDPPVGEGHFYKALCKDLRPSLDWSLENGWMVPLSGDLGSSWYCARLNWPHKEGAQRSFLDMEDGKKQVVKVSADRISEASSFDDNDKKLLGDGREGRFILGSKDDADFALRNYQMSARCSSTLESTIMNIEEVLCRIRWLKGLLKFGSQWSDSKVPSWKFLENRKENIQKDTFQGLDK